MSETLKVYSPYDEHLLRELPLDNADELERKLRRANDLFQNRDAWLLKSERVAVLRKVAAIMADRLENLTRIAAEEGGKPYTDSRIEAERAVDGVHIAIEALRSEGGREIPMGTTASSQNRIAWTVREPIGVVAAVSAFNHPLNLIVHQVIPAVAVGCPVIVKPAGTTPLSCLALVDILREAGLPEGWCQTLIADNDVAEKLVTDPRVNFFSFIGSGFVGWMLRSKLAPGTRCALEHGGVAPAIIEPDADIEAALPLLTKGGFYHAGQVCVSVQRVYAHESIVDRVAGGLAERAAALVVGDPLDAATEVGPLITPANVERVAAWVDEAVAGGGQLLCGGKALSNTCYAPTVVLDPPADSQLSTQEVFGPVVCVYSYRDRLEAVGRANSLNVAFQASVFTRDLEVALDTVKRLNATAVMVNDHTAFRVDWMPFGGRDESGLGMGGIPYSMHDMTRDKLMVIKSKVL